jgi:hypothetical protein
MRTWRHCNNGADAAAMRLLYLHHRLLLLRPKVPQRQFAIIKASQQRCAILLLQ